MTTKHTEAAEDYAAARSWQVADSYYGPNGMLESHRAPQLARLVHLAILEAMRAQREAIVRDLGDYFDKCRDEMADIDAYRVGKIIATAAVKPPQEAQR